MEADVPGKAAERRAGSPASTFDRAPVFRADPGTLYVVATPLGNLRDITLRALDILSTVDVIAAEDTRVSSVLLRHYGIATRPRSLHAHNEAMRAEEVLTLLRARHSLALISDAGTPAISDPGARIVRVVAAAGFPVVPIPGASAAVAALSVAGLTALPFLFLGFLPTAAKARRELLAAYRDLPCALVIYEAPQRVLATAEALAATLDMTRELIVARELTKKFESIARIPLAQAAEWFAADTNRQRGEFVLIVDVATTRPTAIEVLDPEAERLLRLLLVELPPARAARVAAECCGAPRELLYARALALREA